MTTSNVLLFRDDITTGYEILNLPQRVTVITTDETWCGDQRGLSEVFAHRG